MRIAEVLIVLSLVTACSVVPSAPLAMLSPVAESEGDQRSIALIGGESEYDDSLAPLDEVDAYGLEFVQKSRGGTGFEVSASHGDASGNVFIPGTGVAAADITHSVLAAGVRHTWDAGRLHPYVGGGIEIDYAELDARIGFARVSADEYTAGAYVHVGFLVDLVESGRVFLGVDGRLGGLGSELDFGTTIDVDNDYQRVSGIFGFRF